MGNQLNLFQKSLDLWKKEVSNSTTRNSDFDTLSGEEQDVCYFPDLPDNDYMDKLGFPGQFPYTRGIHPNLYRGKLWTMRQFAGYGTPENTNNYGFLKSLLLMSPSYDVTVY